MTRRESLQTRHQALHRCRVDPPIGPNTLLVDRHDIFDGLHTTDSVPPKEPDEIRHRARRSATRSIHHDVERHPPVGEVGKELPRDGVGVPLRGGHCNGSIGHQQDLLGLAPVLDRNGVDVGSIHDDQRAQQRMVVGHDLDRTGLIERRCLDSFDAGPVAPHDRLSRRRAEHARSRDLPSRDRVGDRGFPAPGRPEDCHEQRRVERPEPGLEMRCDRGQRQTTHPLPRHKRRVSEVEVSEHLCERVEICAQSGGASNV